MVSNRGSKNDDAPNEEPYGGLHVEQPPQVTPNPGQCTADGGTPCGHFYAMGECPHVK